MEGTGVCSGGKIDTATRHDPPPTTTDVCQNFLNAGAVPVRSCMRGGVTAGAGRARAACGAPAAPTTSPSPSFCRSSPACTSRTSRTPRAALRTCASSSSPSSTVSKTNKGVSFDHRCAKSLGVRLATAAHAHSRAAALRGGAHGEGGFLPRDDASRGAMGPCFFQRGPGEREGRVHWACKVHGLLPGPELRLPGRPGGRRRVCV